MNRFEPTVLLSELIELGTMLGSDQPPLLDRISRTYGVTVTRDYLDRPAVSVPDAYKLGDKLRREAADLQHATDERIAHETGVQSWQRARDSYWQRNWRWPAPYSDTARIKIVTELANRTIEAESAAGIPPKIAAALSWPNVFVIGISDEDDHAYHKPEGARP